MDILTMAKDGLEVIKQLQPGIEAAAKSVADIGTLGSAAVKLIQHGKQLYTYLLGKSASEKKAESLEIPRTGDVAILVDINRRMLLDVATYLDQQAIDANIIIVTNDPEYGSQTPFLNVDDPAEWREIVQEFNAAIGIIKRYVGPAKLHFFLSTPLPLAFGLGAVWGTVDEAVVYHYEKGTYHPVMEISRRLRQAS